MLDGKAYPFAVSPMLSCLKPLLGVTPLNGLCQPSAKGDRNHQNTPGTDTPFRAIYVPHRSNQNGYTTPQINLVNREVLDLFAGKADLDTTLKTIWRESLQLHHLLAGIFRVSFSEPNQNPGSRLFVEGSSAKAAEVVSKLLERSDTQKKTTSFLWDKIKIRSKDWFTLLTAQLSPAARLQLITYVPSGIDLGI